MWPDFEFVLVSVDSAFTEKAENDPTGCTTWGIWTDPADGHPKVMLIILLHEQVTRALSPVAAVPTASAIVITFPADLTRRVGLQATGSA